MRIARSLLLTLAGLLLVAALAAQAAASKPLTAPVPVVKTAAMLPASAYPWIQPIWASGRVVGVMQVAPALLAGTQPVFPLGLVVPAA